MVATVRPLRPTAWMGTARRTLTRLDSGGVPTLVQRIAYDHPTGHVHVLYFDGKYVCLPLIALMPALALDATRTILDEHHLWILEEILERRWYWRSRS